MLHDASVALQMNQDNCRAFAQSAERARLRSLEPDYRGCAVHVCAVIGICAMTQAPRITGYILSDWVDGSTVRTYINGELR